MNTIDPFRYGPTRVLDASVKPSATCARTRTASGPTTCSPSQGAELGTRTAKLIVGRGEQGGLFANAPGMLALHEAMVFMGKDVADVHMLSIGTMSSSFTVDPRRTSTGGAFDWGGWNPMNMPKRLFGLSISVQEGVAENMLSHLLPERYVLVDDELADERARAVQLDKTDAAARQVLLGTAGQRSKRCLGDPWIQAFLERSPSEAVFFHGEHADKGPPC